MNIIIFIQQTVADKQARCIETKQLSLLAAFSLKDKISKLSARNNAILSP